MTGANALSANELIRKLALRTKSRTMPPIHAGLTKNLFRFAKRGFQQAVEFFGKIDRNPCVNRSLAIEKPLLSGTGKHSVMPDVGVNVQSGRSIKPETDKVLWLDVVTR